MMQAQQSRRNNKESQSTTQQQKQQPLLAFRVLGALPLVNSSFSLAKNYYLKTKDSSDFLKSGLDFAESSVLFASAPLVNKYEQIDHFASNKLNQLEEIYENRDKVVDDIAQKSLKTIKKVTYPVGFTLGLASQARSKAMNMASPMVEKVFDYADEVVDNLMPADEPEDEEYLKMTVLQRKNPLRRVRNRTTLISLVNLPSNSIIYGAHLSLEAYHFSSLLADRFFYNMDRLLKLRSNIQFLTKISSAPFTLVYPSNRQKLYDFLRGDGLDYVNWTIDETLAKGDKLTGYLKENGLPNNAELLETALSGVKQLQQFLSKFKKQSAIEAREGERSAPSESEKKEEEKESKKEESKPVARRRVINNEDRPASFMTGDDVTAEELEQQKQAKSDAKEPVFDLPEILFEEKVDEEGFSRARPSHHHKVIPSRVAHNIAPTTTSSTHTAGAIVHNNPYGALLKGKVHEQATSSRIEKDSIVVMDGTGNVAVAVAHEEEPTLSSKGDDTLFFTDADAEGWKSVDNDVHHRRHHHHAKPHPRKEETQEEPTKEEEMKEEEKEEKPVNLDEHMLVVKSDVGLVAIAESKPNWSSSQEMGEWQQPKKTFHHTTLQQEEKKVHEQQNVHIDAQGNANPYSALQSQ